MWEDNESGEQDTREMRRIGKVQDEEEEEEMGDTSLIDDNQDNTEGRESLGSGGVGSSVSGPSQDIVREEVRREMDDGASTSRANTAQVGYNKPPIVVEIEKLVAREFGRPGFNFASMDSEDLAVRLELLRKTETTKRDNVKFTPKGKNGQDIQAQIVLKRVGDGFEFNNATSKPIVEAVQGTTVQ